MNDDSPTRLSPFIFQQVSLVVLLYKVIHENIFPVLPGIVTNGVSFPFDEILKLMLSSKKVVPFDGFDYKFLLSINHFWRQGQVIVSELFHLPIWQKETGVKHGMNGP